MEVINKNKSIGLIKGSTLLKTYFENIKHSTKTYLFSDDPFI
jgi:hypothetical protein